MVGFHIYLSFQKGMLAIYQAPRRATAFLGPSRARQLSASGCVWLLENACIEEIFAKNGRWWDSLGLDMFMFDIYIYVFIVTDGHGLS